MHEKSTDNRSIVMPVSPAGIPAASPSALKGRMAFDSGAYCDLSGNLENALVNLAGPYRIPHLDLEGHRVYTNTIPRGFVRAPTGPHPAFAIESLIDGLADGMGIDPLELRMKNGVHDGDKLPGKGATLRNSGLQATLRVVADYMNNQDGTGEGNRGWGVACGQWSTNPVTREGPTSSAWAKINEDGTVVLITGVTDNGGGQYGIFSQIG